MASTIQTNGSSDVTQYLGVNPYFPNGSVSEPSGLWYKFVVDASSTPTAIGKLIAYKWAPLSWSVNSTATLAAPTGMCGIVLVAASSAGTTAAIQVRGVVLAFCTTTGVAITPGTALASDSAGNLTPTASTLPGTILAIAAGSLGTSQGATLVSVYIGGY